MGDDITCASCSDIQCVYMCVRIVLVYSAVGRLSGE